ncbi:MULTISPECIES: carboxylating nicotinate-nucleotide diphosphorylase [Clostridia]|jgi:nicotinate-nucleotide pyrophosphorylase (carboxylating)|uniref:nicotinate-nucleotide diphosphorylase (carboxylating) n=1 Tax=Clostridium saudiense TaxID=1414720 RepID=A0ABS2FHP0_9CLOT|nr:MULTISPECIES: carboxylating nicotinate-nucleotide diphosphorylase [Clostridiaceae]MBM6819884.1 carboxylating nicotinate-nucleotide diphosphorylase [Clostridium saudiense]
MLNYSIVDTIIKNSLEEDIPYGDITSVSLVTKGSNAKASLIAKEDGIICGLPVFKRVFTILGQVEFISLFEEGSKVKSGDIIGEVKGDALNILMGERVALNLLQKMSGIATLTNKYVNELKGLNTKILDTRKTTANLRVLEKYSVKIGGGNNHRFSLSDGILIKDNHIGYAGSIKEAIRLTKEKSSFIRKIEVETESKEDVIEALEAGADIIMLDNMSPSQVAEMVKLIDGRALTECSGNITLDTVRNYALSGVDFISSGELTHSVKAFDISLKNFIQL